MNPKKNHYEARARELSRVYDEEPTDYSGYNIPALQRERASLVAEMRTIVEERGEKFSRADAEKCDKLDAEIQEYDDLIDRSEQAQGLHDVVDGRSTQAPNRRDESGTIALRHDERMADRFEARGFGMGETGGEFNLGRIVGALTGKVDRRSMSDAETRALAEGVDATGGFLIPEIFSAKLIDRARNKAQALKAGALTVRMGSDEVHLARLSSGNSANWKIENDPVVDSDAVFERVSLNAKTLVVQQKLSVELQEDLSPEGFRLIENEIVAALALELDRAILRGSGTDPEPRGIRNQAGVNVLDMGTDGATPADYDWLIDAMAAVWAENGEPNAAIYSARTATTLAKLKDSTGQPLRQPEAVAGLSKFVSNQIPGDLTKGTSTEASEAYVGDFSTVLVGVRPSLSIRFRILDQRYMENLQVAMIAWLRADVAMAHPKHMTVVDGITA